MEKDLDLKEFGRLCSNIGKPKEFIKLARYTDQLLGQAIIQFDTPQDKRYFANVFRAVFPDYIVQEMSKILKIFVISINGEEKEMDWKDYMMKTFKET